MTKRQYETELRNIMNVMGKSIRKQLGEECVRTRQDISKHEFPRRYEMKVLSFFREQRNLCYKQIALCKSGSIMKETPDLPQSLHTAVIAVNKGKLSVITKLRREIQEATRKSLRQPDKLVYPVQKVVKSESYSTRESLSELIEVAQDFVNM